MSPPVHPPAGCWQRAPAALPRSETGRSLQHKVQPEQERALSVIFFFLLARKRRRRIIDAAGSLLLGVWARQRWLLLRLSARHDHSAATRSCAEACHGLNKCTATYYWRARSESVRRP